MKKFTDLSLSRRIAIGALFLIALILAYGYWRVTNYGWLYISLYEVSENNTRYQTIKNATVRLLDVNGKLLAEGKGDSLHGVVSLKHPEAGYCVEAEQKAPYSKHDRQRWYDCYEKQATWLMEWVDDVRSMDLEAGKCSIKDIRISIRKSRDNWWLWWVPHPHIGGKPTTYFSTGIRADLNNCEVLD